MKIETKFNLGDRVLTPISERVGIIQCIHIRKYGSDTIHVYEVCIDFPYIRTNSYAAVAVTFNERDLRKEAA